ncbi:MAG TPA: kelch repeat-containing protein [Myxococcales bacterium]|nr:kelch repeat-containing protein [Myxococcales bacterium]
MMLLGACSGYGNSGAPVSRLQLTAAADAVFVGERAQLTPIFDGGAGSIDGIGAVRSGISVDTPILSRTTIFTLRVRDGYGEVQARTTVRANYRDRIRALAAAPVGQTSHVAVALPGGRAIVMGGNTTATSHVPDSTLTQIFDAATEHFTPGPDLPFSAEAPRTTATALTGGGFVLVGAGTNAGVGALGSVITARFDPSAATFTRVGDAVTAGIPLRTVSSLSDGGALLTGGLTANVDRFDAASGQWRAAGPIQQIRALHTTTLLRDGRVLIAGGVGCCSLTDPSRVSELNTAEIYDPASDAFTPTGSMGAARAEHAAALLPDGRVLIAGGNTQDDEATSPPLGTEIFDPASGRFTSAGDLQAPRDSHAAVTLTDGRVLVIGGRVPAEISGKQGVGISSTEIFDPATGMWAPGPTLDAAFYGATITMLSNGKVLVFGGQDVDGFPQSATALFE